jgi:hypothetical protein
VVLPHPCVRSGSDGATHSRAAGIYTGRITSATKGDAAKGNGSSHLAVYPHPARSMCLQLCLNWASEPECISNGVFP